MKKTHDVLEKLRDELEAKNALHCHIEGEHTHKTKWDILPCCPGARIDYVEKEFKYY